MGLLLSFLSLRQSPYCQNSTCVSANEDGWLSVGWILRDAEEEERAKTEGECTKNEGKKVKGRRQAELERMPRERGRESKERLMAEGARERGGEAGYREKK